MSFSLSSRLFSRSRRPLFALTTALCLASHSAFWGVLQPAKALSKEFEVHFALGSDYMERDQYKQAIPEFDAALKNNTDTGAKVAEAYVQRGTAYSSLAKYDKAIKDLDKGISINKNSDLGYNNRGALYFRTQHADKAIADFDQALKLNPKNKYAAVNRAGCYLLTKDPGKGANNTLAWLDGHKWTSDFSGHAAVLTALAFLASGDEQAYQHMCQTSLKKLDRLKWPFQAFKYFQGKLKDEEVLEEAQDSTYNMTQAQCFMGLHSFFTNKKADSALKFEFVDKHGTINSVEYWLVKAFLKLHEKDFGTQKSK